MSDRHFDRARWRAIVLFLVSQSLAVSSDLAATDLREQRGGVEILRDVAYVSYEQLAKPLTADVYRPVGQAGPLPTILMVHGGAWFAGDKSHVATHAHYAATKGFAVMAIDYRLAPAHKFPAQLDDCQSALQWLQQNAARYGFDANQVVGYGYSAGAQLVSLLATSQNSRLEEAPDVPRLQAVVAGGTPCDFGWMPPDAETLVYWLGGTRREIPEVYHQASPIRFVDGADPPTYLFHGASDRLVPLIGARQMHRQLERAGAKAELYVVPEAGHLEAFRDQGAREKAIEFLQRSLKVDP